METEPRDAELVFEREDPYQKIESKTQNCKDIAFLRENTRKRSCVVELYHTTSKLSGCVKNSLLVIFIYIYL